jgi:glycosyltransferase involved in cell wall biosynthesis
MRICIVSEYFDGTGSTPTILRNLAVFLRQEYPDVAIDVIASTNAYRGKQRLKSETTADGIRITRVPTPKSNRASATLRLLLGASFSLAAASVLLMRPGYDLVFVVTNPPAAPFAAQLVRRLRGTPYVYLIHDLYPDVAAVLGVVDSNSPATRALAALQRSWLHGARKVVVLGRCMQAHIAKRYSLPADRMAVITNWCDPLEVTGKSTSSYRAEKKLDGIVVLYAGNFGHYQDFDDVLSAASILRDSDPDITIALVGNGVREAAIKQRVANENLTNVKVFPLVSNPEYPDVLAAADIALVTLARGAEGVGVPGKFYNVLASARPTIAVVAPTSEVALVLREDDCGIQVSHGSPEELAGAIRHLAHDEAERLRMGANARNAMLRKYTIKQVGGRFRHLFDEVAASHT